MNTVMDVIRRMKQDLSALDAEIGAIHPDILDPQTLGIKSRMLDDLFDNRIDSARRSRVRLLDGDCENSPFRYHTVT